MLLQIGVKALIQNNKGQYLLLKHQALTNETGIEYWTIPGGRIEVEESLEKGLKRELKEEVGMELIHMQKLLAAQDIFTRSGNHIVRLTYDVVAEGTVNIGNDPENDHTEYRWVTPTEAIQLHCDEQLEEVFKQLLASNKSD